MRLLKSLVLVSLLTASGVHSAPQYTLEQICNRYGNFNQCHLVPFCKEISFSSGCYLAPGAPQYVESLCKMQVTEQGCRIMESQGNCTWIQTSSSVCAAKTDRL